MTRGEFVEYPIGEGQYPSEAIFVRRSQSKSEEDGFLMSLVYDSSRNRSYVGIIDALEPEKGFLGKAWFDQPIPFTFHGGFMARDEN